MIPTASAQGRRATTGVGLVTGFLGSGKTTLLSRVLHEPSMQRTAVIVNEFGAISIDHLLIREVRDNIIELKNGCLCCSIQGDLLMTLRDLHTRRLLGDVAPFDYVVIETTGLADPVPLVHTFTTNRPLQSVYQLDVVISTVDVQQAERTAEEHPMCRRQIAFADVLLLTKCDLVDAGQRRRVTAWLTSQNRFAHVHEVANGEIDPALLFRRRLFDARPSAALQAADAAHSGASEHGTPHAELYATHVFSSSGALSFAGTLAFLNRLLREKPQSVLRIKGLAAFAEHRGRIALIQAVQQRFSPVQWLDDWPSEDHTSRLVVIGRDLDFGQLDRDFRAVCLA